MWKTSLLHADNPRFCYFDMHVHQDAINEQIIYKETPLLMFTLEHLRYVTYAPLVIIPCSEAQADEGQPSTMRHKMHSSSEGITTGICLQDYHHMNGIFHVFLQAHSTLMQQDHHPPRHVLVMEPLLVCAMISMQ